MWRLEHIHAENFSAFKTLDYSPLKGHATLIFGNNMDNDSQKSNGSGKSALIEAIAVGLTGATLRNIKTEEIINDNADEAIVKLELTNEFTRQDLTIRRVLSRKNPQVISLTSMDFETADGGIASPVEIPQSSVADYNKYILDTLGLSKDDIYANYILCKHKYQSFLSSSDKDKKEIINRFSNGNLVDESIAALQADMAPIEEKLTEAKSAVDIATGRVSAIEEQIEDAINQSAERSKSKADRIREWKELIAQKREHIREQEDQIRSNNTILDKLDEIAAKLDKLEKGKLGVKDAYEAIKQLFADNSLRPLPDFAQKLSELEASLTKLEESYNMKVADSKKLEKQLAVTKEKHLQLQADYDAFKKKFDKELPEVNEQIKKLLADVSDLESKLAKYKADRTSMENRMAAYRKQLAGVITCPKCHHEFTLANDIDIEQVRDALADLEGVNDENEIRIESCQKEIDKTTVSGKEARAKQNKLRDEQADWSGRVSQSQVELNECTSRLSNAKEMCSDVFARMGQVERSIDAVRTNMFDEAFKIVDNETDNAENANERCNTNIKNAEGAIQSYEESIADVNRASENNIIDTLKESKAKYQEELEVAISKKESVERELTKYKIQEATFVEFKTHLANSKIEALSHITNEFLEAIGSDIRIAFSGFTVLKSGKVRDKISISLLRDGVNCGSFDKFSEGEKARVNLANILAMHKLTNVSCSEGKGLDLLILDEILDATDETGLANIFESLNTFQITSMVVSHGNIAENYPYKLVVNKQNGISFI